MNSLVSKHVALLIVLLVSPILCICLSLGPSFAADVTEVEYSEELIAVEEVPGPEEFDVEIIEESPVEGKALALAGRFYVGAGALYDFSFFDVEPFTLSHIWIVGSSVKSWSTEIDRDPDNSFGFNLKAGYYIMEYLAVELLFQYHFKFEYDGEGSLSGWPASNVYFEDTEEINGEYKGYDVTLNGKGYLLTGDVRPYGVVGLGYMSFKREQDQDYSGLKRYYYTSYTTTIRTSSSHHYSDDLSGFCARVGAGCDYFLTENLGLEAEVAYNMGFSDVDAVRFLGANLGVLYVF